MSMTALITLTVHPYHTSSPCDTQVKSMLCLTPCALYQWTGGQVGVDALPFRRRLQVRVCFVEPKHYGIIRHEGAGFVNFGGRKLAQVLGNGTRIKTRC